MINFLWMKFKYLIILSFLISNVYAVRIGDEVNNGGGSAEKNILYAYTNMKRYLSVCIKSRACKLSNKERGVLVKVHAHMEDEYKNREQIKLVSEKEYPGTFMLDDEMKIAKTGNLVGDPIYINKDLLYTKNGNGFYEAITIPQAVSVLVHEFAHHHRHDFDKGKKSDLCMFFDLLGNKVSMMLEKYMSSSKLLPFSNEIMVTIFNERTSKSFPQILIYVYDQIIDASDEFKKALRCPYFTIPGIGRDISINSKKKPLGTTFHNVYWKAKKGRKLTIVGNLYNFCTQKSTFLTNNKKYEAHISFQLENSPKSEDLTGTVFKKNSLKVKQVYNPWWKFLKLPF